MRGRNERKGETVLNVATLQVDCDGAALKFCGVSQRSSREDTCHRRLALLTVDVAMPVEKLLDFARDCSVPCRVLKPCTGVALLMLWLC